MTTNNNQEFIVGVSSIDGYAHDNSAVILRKGILTFAGSEERYTRKKHDGSFPINVISSGLKYCKIKSSFVKTVAVGYPKRRILSIITNRYFFEIIPFVLSLLVNRNLGLIGDTFSFIKSMVNKNIKEHSEMQRFLKNKKIQYIDHHLAHSASAYFTSGFKKCISIAVDGFGSDSSGVIRSGSVYLCDKGEINEVMSIPIYASLGDFFHSVTYMLGFKPGDGEGKTMGLAAYGKPNKTYRALRPYCPTFKDGVWAPSNDWLSGLIPTMPSVIHIFRYTRFGKLTQKLLDKTKNENVAAGAQKLLEEELVKLVEYLVKKYPDFDNVTLSGGIFLNVKANKKILEIPGVNNVFVHPHAGDGGVALGAAFMATPTEQLKKIVGKPLLSCGLGLSFTDREIYAELSKYNAQVVYKKHKDIAKYTVDKIWSGSVIGWFQGREEWGPRALGFRSVLADPRKSSVKERINHVLKNREWFMPFAPSILEEEGKNYFKNFVPCPFMTLTFDIFPKKAKLFPAAMHIDRTARPNSVNSQNNSLYYKLLRRWFKKSKLPILLNTSFNRHGLPIVNTPKDAVDHLLMGAVDELIIGNYSVLRSPNSKNLQ